MSISLIRVVNEQTLNRSILLDKIDRSQGNFENYAQVAKQQLYVPYSNPLNTAVKGYIDLVPTDEVLLQAENNGSIGGLALTTPPRVSVSTVNSAKIQVSEVTAASNAATDTTIDGTVFLSVAPDVTQVILTNLSGVKQTIDESAFTVHTAIQIVIPDSEVSGTPATGWKAQVFANSKLSNEFTLI